MNTRKLHTLLTYSIAGVWVINGLLCKVLQLVPRHEEIVGRILGDARASLITVLIGISEIAMAAWIVSRFKSRLNAVVQIIIIATMNTLELILTPDLLLWGKANAVFALLLILIIYYNEFVLNRNITEPS